MINICSINKYIKHTFGKENFFQNMEDIDENYIITEMNKSFEKVPKSNNFYDGNLAEGQWFEYHQNNGELCHYSQVVGNSGIYLIITDVCTGEIVQDTRPWQMKY